MWQSAQSLPIAGAPPTPGFTIARSSKFALIAFKWLRAGPVAAFAADGLGRRQPGSGRGSGGGSRKSR